MDVASQIMPIILYFLLSVLIVVAIVFLYKLTKTVDKANVVLDDVYGNIKKLQLYDTGVTASFGDEFITLSVCAYHVENGRLVVVAKRIK